MKLKLTGIKNIFVYDCPPPEPNTDYLLKLRIALEGEYTPKSGGEDDEVRYDMKAVNAEGLENLKTNISYKVKKGKTPSQELRIEIYNYLTSIGVDCFENNYEAVMKHIIGVVEKSKGKRTLWERAEEAL